MIIAAVVVLAILGVVLAVALSGDPDGTAKGDGGKDDTAASAGATAGTDKQQDSAKGSGGDEPSGGQPSGEASATDDTASGSGDKGSGSGSGSDDEAVPDDYKSVVDKRFRFSMTMPDDFKQTDVAGESSGAIYSEDGEFPVSRSTSTPSRATTRSARGNSSKAR